MRIELLADLLVGLGLQLAFIASVNGYGRALEDEADRGGFAKLAAAGYDPAEAPKVYQSLMAERGDSGKLEAFFFGSHPQLALRIENARSWLAAHPGAAGSAGGAAPTLGDEERFARRIRPVVRDDARLNLELGRLELAEAELEQVLAWMPEDPEAWFLRARLRLAQADAEPGPDAKAVRVGEAKDALHEAVRLDPDRPAPHRELGLLYYREGDLPAACREMGLYLELAPEAEDAARMRDYLVELELDGACGRDPSPPGSTDHHDATPRAPGPPASYPFG
jgi:beta-barrel assembly-enhancing protease